MRKLGPIRIAAARVIAQPPELVYAFLADLDNHHRLGDRRLRLERLAWDRSGAVIVIRTPIGVRRTATATVTTACAPSRFGGRVQIGSRSRARTHWRIEPHGSGALVALEAIVAAGLLDALLLSFGGRRWLHHRFALVLARLSVALEA